MEKFLPKYNLPLFLRELKNKYEVYAPQENRGGEIEFSKLVFPERVRLDYAISLLPPSKIIIPQYGNYRSKSKEGKKILFGVHLADLEAILYLDKIFAHPIEDRIYLEQRKEFILVGVDYPHHPDAFYKTDRAQLKKQCDLYLDDVGEAYLAISRTAEGRQLTQSRYFEVATKNYQEADHITDNKLLRQPNKLRQAVLNRDHPLWDEMAEKCLGCGICTYVCPLCFCFDQKEADTLTQKPEQIRTWSSCLLKDFHTVAGGHCFKEKLKDRFYNWYYHKFVRMVDEYGQPGCVGCNRCSIYCPAGINIYENLQRLLSGR